MIEANDLIFTVGLIVIFIILLYFFFFISSKRCLNCGSKKLKVITLEEEYKGIKLTSFYLECEKCGYIWHWKTV